jgi:1-acyl-sn-glycerol-3-phosphate acyltransferase
VRPNRGARPGRRVRSSLRLIAYPPAMSLRRTVARAYWRLSRWTLVTERVPRDRPGILIGAPHTSNWDFVLMLAIGGEGDLPFKWLGKHTLFKRPFGGLMRALGGIPVDRRDPAGLVDQLIARIAAGEVFHLVVTPEGSRSGDGWKSGFYRIARATDLPVTLGYVDRTTMTTGLGPTVSMTGDVRADMDVIRAFYADKAGFVPARRTEPRLREESAT